MKILRLEAENVKRLKAVMIEPGDKNLVVISGRNGQGKTSVLDCLLYAVGGGKAIPGKPVREGEDGAKIKIDLGDNAPELTVKRVWTDNGKSYLTVTANDGEFEIKSPQAALDRLVGDLSFDPTEFERLGAKERRTMLLRLAGLEEIMLRLSNGRRVAEEERRDAGRDMKKLQAAFDQMAGPTVLADAEITDTAALGEKITDAKLNNRQIADLGDDVATLDERVADKSIMVKNMIEAQEAELKRIQKEHARRLDEAQEEFHGLEAEHSKKVDSLAVLELVDLEPLEYRMSGAEDRNTSIRHAIEYDRANVTLKEAVQLHLDAQLSIDAMLDEETKAIANAAFPIAGLGVTDELVTYNEVPFEQLGGSERLRISLAVAMALNPKLRVIRCTDGSLLDSESLKIVEEMAAEKDYQVWLEVVDESGEMGIVIEDGSIVGAAELSDG